jgi:hypothetical protein
VSDEVPETEKAKLALSILKGDVTLADVCAEQRVAAEVVQGWVDDAVATVGSLRQVYEKLGKVKTRVSMFLLPGGALSCIRFHDQDVPLGEKSDYWCSSVPLSDLADGELILNYSRSECRLEEIDIAFSNLCLPTRFVGSETETTEYSVEMELDFKYKTGKIRFARPDKIQFQGEPLTSIRFVLPAPLDGDVWLAVDHSSRRLYNIKISKADQCLPERFFTPDRTP